MYISDKKRGVERILNEEDLIRLLDKYENWIEVDSQNKEEVRELDARGYIERIHHKSYGGVPKEYVQATEEALKIYFGKYGTLYQKILYCFLKKPIRYKPKEINSNNPK